MLEIQAETRERLRAWLLHFKAIYGGSQRGLAEALGISEVTVSNALKSQVGPGLKCLLAMHYNMGSDLRRLVRDDPDKEDAGLRAK